MRCLSIRNKKLRMNNLDILNKKKKKKRKENIDFMVEETQDQVTELESENVKLKDIILNLKSDILRDTLIL